MRQFRRPLLIGAASALFAVAACANITVNIYFPEKDVKSAYKSLEEELLQTPQQEPQGAPTSSLQQKQQPLLTVIRTWRIALVTDAMAEEDLSRRITDEIKSHPEVVAAYKGMGQRLTSLNQLRDQGLAGETKDGRVVLRANPPQVGEAEAALLREENSDREVVMNGMAKAILKITRQEATPANLARARTQASETFASIRRDAAKPSWWVQLPNGAWARK